MIKDGVGREQDKKGNSEKFSIARADCPSPIQKHELRLATGVRMWKALNIS